VREKSAIRLAILALSLLAMSQMATAAEAPDFRNARWGMTSREVLASETDCMIVDVDGTGEMLMGMSTVAGYSATVIYEFDPLGQLTGGGYMFSEQHTDGSLYIDDFEDLQGLLTEKYGQPVFAGPNWKNELFRYQRASWGTALALGHVSFLARWETPRTTIMLYLNGDDFKIRHAIIYKSNVVVGNPAVRSTKGL